MIYLKGSKAVSLKRRAVGKNAMTIRVFFCFAKVKSNGFEVVRNISNFGGDSSALEMEEISALPQC